MDRAQATVGKKIIFVVFALASMHCSKPLLFGKVQQVSVVRGSFNGSYSQVYDAAKLALSQSGYSIEEEFRQKGTIVTDWKPSTPDSHYVQVFDRRDYGTVGAYYHLDLALYQEAGKIQVAIRSVSKSIVTRLKSTEIEEREILSRMQEYLRGKEIEVTNLGIKS